MPEIVLIAKTQYNELRQRLINIDERLEELMGGAKAPKREIPNAPDNPEEPEDRVTGPPEAKEDKAIHGKGPIVDSPGDKLEKMKNALKGDSGRQSKKVT